MDTTSTAPQGAAEPSAKRGAKREVFLTLVALPPAELQALIVGLETEEAEKRAGEESLRHLHGAALDGLSAQPVFADEREEELFTAWCVAVQEYGAVALALDFAQRAQQVQKRRRKGKRKKQNKRAA